jgi:hypothetical protein
MCLQNDAVSELEVSVLRAALSNDTSHHWSQTTDALWGKSESASLDASYWNPRFYQTTSPESRAQQPLQWMGRDTPYKTLSQLDSELDELINAVAEGLDALSSTIGNPEGKALEQLERGITQVTGRLKHIRTIPCSIIEEMTLQQVMIERYEGLLSGMEQAMKTIRAREGPRITAHAYDNSKSEQLGAS